MRSVPSHREIIQNILAGLTVSFVALSLGAAFGVLSGRGAFVGMLSAAILPIIASTFGGTRLQSASPTGISSTMTAIIVAFAHDSFAKQFPGIAADHFVNIVLLLTGALLIISAILQLGKFVIYIPNVVISGFMNGVAIIIWMDQIRRLFGLAGKTAFAGDIVTNVIVALCTFLLTFVIPYLLRNFAPKLSGLLPVSLLAIVMMSLIVDLSHISIGHVELTTTINSVHDFLTFVHGQIPTEWSIAIVLLALPFALKLLVLAYLDNLLTALIIDKMTGEPTKQNRELFVQGIAMGIIGCCGAVPGAQATANSVLLLKEKATMRLGGILVGVFALLEMILLQKTINAIPLAVFSGILFKVGFDVFDWTPLRLYVREWIKDWHNLAHNFFSRHDDEPIFVTNREFLMIAGTTLITVLWDLNIAVFLFTITFYVGNLFLWKRNPIRDLKPMVETEGMLDEV